MILLIEKGGGTRPCETLATIFGKPDEGANSYSTEKDKQEEIDLNNTINIISPDLSGEIFFVPMPHLDSSLN